MLLSWSRLDIFLLAQFITFNLRYSIHHRHTFNNICIHPRKIVLIFTYVAITMYVHIIVVITCRGRAVTNVVRTCDPTPLLAIYALKYVYSNSLGTNSLLGHSTLT